MASEIDKIIELYGKQNNTLSKLIEENHRLKESILDDTNIEKLDKLIEKTGQSEEKLKKVIKAINKDLETKISFDNLSGGILELENSMNELNKTINENSKIISENKRKLKDLNKETEEYKNLKAETDELEKNQEEYLDLLKEKKEATDLLKDSTNEYYSNANEQQKELNKRQVEGITILDDYTEKWEQRTKALKNGVSKIKKGYKGITDAVKNMFGPWSKANQEAFNYARTVGMSRETTQKFLSDTTSWASKNDIGILFNKTTEELIKMQSKYSEVLGRNVQLSGEQKKDMLAMEKFIGEEGMMDIANNLENFGLGMSDSADFVKKTLDEATKSGISASKLTKTIRENIKMAQNYTFKNGLDGLTSMAKKAIQLKTDLSLVNQFAEKTSTVEGAISTGAQLQVLGGSYAMGSDPLSMMYESLSDTEGLFDRAVNMAKGKVFYNEKTGNFEMGAMDRYLMKQAATTMGIDPSKLIDVAYRQASLGKIESQIGLNKNISGDKDMVEMIKNLATWDKGEAFVTIDGKQKNVKDLSVDDKSKLEAMGRTDSENLQDMAINLRSITEIMDGTKKEKENEQANLLNGIGKHFHNLLNNNTNLLNVISNIAAWGTIIGGGFGVANSLLYSIRGILTSMQGVGNLFGDDAIDGDDFLGNRKGNKKGKKGKGKKGGRKGKNISKNKVSKIGNFGKIGKLGKFGGALKTGGKFLGKAGAVGAGVISLGIDMASGDYEKNKARSLGNAGALTTGALIGGAIGSVIPVVGTAVGAAIGSLVAWGGSVAVEAIQKDGREKFRKNLISKLDGAGFLSELFVGENSLSGDYNEKELLKIKEALSDKKLSNGELSSYLMNKIEANGDFSKIERLGIKRELGDGGLLIGKTHQEGGMPILGSDISVEGGEFVVNKKSTKENLPLLNEINKGKYNMVAKEPLGKQMVVQEKNTSKNNSNNVDKVNINPISINLSGTIKLDTGNTQFNITDELIKNPHLITKITELISKELNVLNYGAYNKTNYKQRFT